MTAGSSPPNIGRYEIVGRLATGGMAEVFLGRLRGPHGFERTAVIKRILPHLALDRAMVDMFLDEARIIANLRHPNLIQVHELGRDGDQLFMVMDFLEGESVAGLCRRLASRDEQLDFALAAHIVAEACAGLHAAHEATSRDGRTLEIVHRDVSPQNLFVGYSGTVHVIDFGIATTVDRITRTEAGTIRGKFEYLAPEQLESIPIDRRVDVFALGIVLFELATGRRLYRRDSQAATMMAILTDAVPDVASLRPDAPVALQAICARALAKNRCDRYANAAEMRRDLLAFVRKRTDEDLSEALSRRMGALFSDRIQEKCEMLRRVRQGASLDTMPDAEVDASIELPTICEHAFASPATVVPVPLRKRRRWLPAAALLAAGVGIASVVGTYRSSLATQSIDSHASAALNPSVSSAEVASSSPPGTVHMRVESSPVSATVVVAGIVRGPTPLDLDLGGGTAPVELELHATGFAPALLTVVPERDQIVNVALSAPPARRPPPGAAQRAPVTRSPRAATPARPSATIW